jgi:hypothetical protein
MSKKAYNPLPVGAVKPSPPPAPPKVNQDRCERAAEILEHQSNVVGKGTMLPSDILWLVSRALRGKE